MVSIGSESGYNLSVHPPQRHLTSRFSRRLLMALFGAISQRRGHTTTLYQVFLRHSLSWRLESILPCHLRITQELKRRSSYSYILQFLVVKSGKGRWNKQWSLKVFKSNVSFVNKCKCWLTWTPSGQTVGHIGVISFTNGRSIGEMPHRLNWGQSLLQYLQWLYR